MKNLGIASALAALASAVTLTSVQADASPRPSQVQQVATSVADPTSAGGAERTSAGKRVDVGFDFGFSTDFGGDSANGNAGGKARVDGRVKFPSRSRAVIDIWALEDLCNSGKDDGLGSFLFISAEYQDATLTLDYRFVAKYVGACDQGFTYGYDINYNPTAFDGMKLKSVKFQLRECTKNGSQCSDNPKDYSWSRKIDNPKVG